jgi:hypothetical protein
VLCPHPFDTRLTPVNLHDNKALDNLRDIFLATGAFEDVHAPGGGSSKAHEVRQMLYQFLEGRQFLETYTHPSLDYYTLMSTARTRAIKPSRKLAFLTDFCTFLSSAGPLDIYDMNNKLVGARFCIPLELVETLQQSTSLLSDATKTTYGNVNACGFSMVRHYIIWANSAPSPFYRSDYSNHKKEADTWLAANQALWDRTTNQVRFLAPEMIVKMNVPVKMLPPTLKPLCGAYHGVGIKKSVEDPADSATHPDSKDNFSIFNAVVPFRD